MDLVGHEVLTASEIAKIPHIPGLAKKDKFSLVALPIIKDLLFVTGAESAEGMSFVCKTAMKPKKLRVVNTLNEYVGDMSDHGVFRRNGKPYLFLSCGRWTHYHQETDTPAVLNYDKMERIGRYLVELCENAIKSELTEDVDVDTAEFEAKSIQKAFFPITPLILRALGVNALKTRTDIDKLAKTLQRSGL
jgi:hypothetical protein